MQDPNYYREYYRKHREELAAKRRRRYADDPEYRERVRTRAVESFRRKRDEKLKAQGGVPKPARSRGFNRPRVMEQDGKSILLHGVGIFADHVGVSVQSITSWEQEKIAPPPTVIDEMNRRWYSDAHINLIAHVVQKFRLEGGRRVADLKDRVWQAWEKK